MKYRDLAEIGVKLLGIFSAIQCLASLPTAFSMHQNYSFYQSMENDFMNEAAIGAFSKIALAATSTCILYFLLSILLLMASSKIANWLVKSDAEIATNLKVESLSRFAIQLAGIYALITWLPSFAQTLVRTLIYGSWQIPQVPTLQRFYENWSVLISPAIGTILGLILLFGINGMIRLVRLARPMTDRKGPLNGNT